MRIAAIIGMAHNTMQLFNTLSLMSKSMQVHAVVTFREQRALSHNDEPGDRQAPAMKHAAQSSAHSCGCYCSGFICLLLQVLHGVPMPFAAARGLPPVAYASSTSLQCTHMVKSAKIQPYPIWTEPE